MTGDDVTRVQNAFVRGDDPLGTATYVALVGSTDWFPYELLLPVAPIITRWWSDMDDWQMNWVTYVVLPQ